MTSRPLLALFAALALTGVVPHARAETPVPTTAPTPAPVTVSVTVAGVKTQSGAIMIALHDEANWNGRPIATARATVTGQTVAIMLPAPAAGRYGLKLYQDVNGNGAMDANAFGMPTEPFGFSNDAPVRFGPPAFAAAAFDVTAAGASQTITLK